MSLLRDLDEYVENALVAEINRRIWARERGVCDYCGRTPETVVCKFPERHAAPAKQKKGLAYTADQRPVGW